jgi:hypothetical protein
MRGDQLMEPGHPGHAFTQPRPGQPMTSFIDQRDIMMSLSPVIPGIQHPPHPPPPAAPCRTSQRGTTAL